MRNNLYRILIILIIGFIEIGYSQDIVYFDHITTDDGLSQSDINAVYQDNQGFMWFGTHDGLNKYDGYSFTIYNLDANSTESISSNLIYDIAGDKDGNLWIGTTGSGLNYFDRSAENFTVYKHEKGNNNSLSNDHITSVFLDKSNRLWLGTNDGLNMVDLQKSKDSLSFKRFNPEHEPFVTGWDGNSIFAIYEDSKNQIWVGGHGGLYKLSRDENGENYFKLVNTSVGLPRATVTAIGEDKNGKMIISTEDGTYSQGDRNENPKLQKIHNESSNSILVDNANNIWVGTNNGLLNFDNSKINKLPSLKNHFIDDPQNVFSLSKNIVKSIFQDKTGIIWIGTNGGGINKYDPERKQFRHIRKTLSENSLSYDKIRSIFEDSNGTLWLGTEGGGLNMMKKANDNGQYKKFKNFKTILKPFAIAETNYMGKKTLFIGAENTPGLFHLDISNPNNIKEENIIAFDNIKHSVFSLLVDSNQNIWIGTYSGGVYRWLYDVDSKTYEKSILRNNISNPNSISSDIIRYIYEDQNGVIWFATGDGLCRLSPKESIKKQPKFKVYKNELGNTKTLSHNYILSVYESKAGELWVGTFGGGLNKLNTSQDLANETFTSYSEEDGLPNNVIKGILEDDDGNLWLSSNQGLSRFNPEKKTIKNYDVNDGLQSNEFQELACLRRKNGEMLFGGINGFNVFYPEKIVKNLAEAETMITNFSIFNNTVDIGEKINGRTILNKTINNTKEIELKYKENSFSFEFAALHYAAPGKNQFSYILEGFDKEWTQTTANKRFANYTNLEPGDYTLKVKASNNDGIWDTTPSEIKIKVVPPFWRSNMAYILYSLIGLGILWLFWRYTFIKTSEKHQLELEHLQKEKSEEMQQIKLEFFTNISHEFRTPLTLIKGPLEYLQKKGSQLENQIVQEQYTLMHKNTNYLLRLVNQLLDFRKINQGKMHLVVRNSNIVDFLKEVAEPFQFLAHKKRIDFKIVLSKVPSKTWFDHDALEKIMNNLLSNAFKFTPKNGSIEIIIDTKKNLPSTGALISKQKYQDCVEIQVKDSGPGIEKSKLHNIFERFYVEKESNKINREGVGIGLSFTKNLIELHQGEINVVSELEKGTNFVVQLPIEKEAYMNIEEISCKEISDSDFLIRSSESESFAIGLNDEILDENISNSRSKLPILLILDDNADIRTFIKQSLSDEYFIYEAENGKQGLEIANKVMPNIILSDVIMPVMDGMEFCEKIKTHKETSHIPIILLTAKSSEESVMSGLKNGADDYLTKPFNMELLKVKMANTISQRDEMRKQFNRKISLQPSEVTVTSLDEKFLNHAIEIVEKHMMNTDFNVEMLVKEMGLSRSNLYLKFKEITGLSSSEFIRNIRLKRAVQLFEKSDLSVKEIMYMTGFNTASYFSKCFKKQFGVIPSEYVRQMKNNKEASGI